MTRFLSVLLLAAGALPGTAFAQAMSANPTSVALYMNIPQYIGCNALWQSTGDFDRVQTLSNLPAEDGGVIELHCGWNTGQASFSVDGEVQVATPFPWRSPITIQDGATATSYVWSGAPTAGQTAFDDRRTLNGVPSGNGSFVAIYYWQAPVTAQQEPGMYLLSAVFTVTSL